ncbi:Periplasmic serine endoprotease DegP precursor [Gimesia alba]|uniref:Periplasmic serine endoprotease DegP n=1 Tax=Gimesia alba TaxID=2527973 RepID=A0A517RJY5_9PLAN|nr:trypsin-like peptidase domain-containing protein [Gimesia alba]QDT44169.1 Periplasmic serine endoprotease DegP precursor [Gimesia alba]
MKNRYSLLLVLALVVSASLWNTCFESPLNSKQLEAKVPSQANPRQPHSTIFSHSTLHEGSKHLAKIAKLATPSVVHIQCERQTPRGAVEETGSGVIVRGEGAPGLYIVTNRHVVRDSNGKSISIQLHDGRVIHPQRKWEDKDTDLAILKLNITDVPPADWGDSDKLDIGHMVLAMGSPFGLSESVTLGIISAKGRRSLQLGSGSEVLNQNFLQTDAAINPGNSGGPLIDLEGKIIGINTAIASNSGGNDGIGFSIPSKLVRHVFNQLVKYGQVYRAYLGVQLDPEFSIATAGRLKMDRVRGARVVKVISNTPASRANLKYDDVILSFGGIDVLDQNHLINLVSLTAIDNRVSVVLLRNGRKVNVMVELANRQILDELERKQKESQQSSRRFRTPAEPMSFQRVKHSQEQDILTGLQLYAMNEELADQLGFEKSQSGLLVMNVDQQSSLHGVVKLYDVIEEVAGTPVNNLSEFRQVLSQNQTRTNLVLKVSNGKQGKPHHQLVIWQRKQ